MRVALIALVVAGAVVAFVVARSGGDDDGTTAAQATVTDATGPTVAPTTRTSRTEPTTRSGPAPPPLTWIRVRGGQATGGVERIEVRRNDVVRLLVTTRDTTDEVHLHGYDISRQLSPREPARFRFRAAITGVFEIELEDVGHQIAELRVAP